ncbi:MAG: type II secretion system F family protein [Gammaproteobacteria bacterium]|nr:type II secretion system F family protein [Gammaproteobacteria bacterium]
MPTFQCKFIRGGEVVQETRDADNESLLILALQNEGVIPLKVRESKDTIISFLFPSATGKLKVTAKDIGVFTRELATLLNAGLPLDRSLTVLIDLTEDGTPINTMTASILEKVKGGAPLSEALESQNKVFSRFYLNMIRAGEAGGSMESVLERLAEYLEQSKELRDTVSTALIYPAILIVISFISVFLLLTFVVPQFTEMFENSGKELPVPTQIVVGAAELLKSYWWAVLIGFVFIVAIVKFQLSDSKRRRVWDYRFLKIPMVNDLIVKLQVASFSRTLETLLGNGVTLLTGLSIAKETLTNAAIADTVEEAADSLKQGGGMSEILIESGRFPVMALQMIKLGEETGRLQEMLEKVAITYDKEIKHSIHRMLALLEPALIVLLGIIIAAIIISILMAILSVNDLAF